MKQLPHDPARMAASFEAAPPTETSTDILLSSRNKTGQEDTTESHQHHEHAPLSFSSRGGGLKADSAVAADELRRLSLSPAPSARLSPVPYGLYHPAASGYSSPSAVGPAAPSSLKGFWIRNKPSILVALSQLFGASMNLSARLLELDGEGMHPFQVLFIRQSLTAIACFSYMWWMSIPDFPLGKREVRWLLLARGCSGFFGIYGMWYSMMYLPLADATVITFLAPGVAGIICYFLLREPFTRAEQLATFVALLGVVLIAQPASLFSSSTAPRTSSTDRHTKHGSRALPGLDHEATAEERLVAVGVALLGVLGAAGAFTSIRSIGKRAHPLISVNFFAMTCTVICASVLVFAPMLDIGQPHLRWIPPTSVKQWFLLLSLGLFGFIMQYLLTSGLAADKSNRANSMIYTHMLFAVSFDRWVFHHSMGLVSFGGCALILGSAITVVLMKRKPVSKPEDVERLTNVGDDGDGVEYRDGPVSFNNYRLIDTSRNN